MIELKENDKLEVLVRAFAMDRSQTIKEVYRCFRKPFLRFAKNFSIEEDKVIDCFQESVIGLYENLAMQKIAMLDNTIKTYLFTIGRNKMLNIITREKSPQSLDQIKNQTGGQVHSDRDYGPLIQQAFNQLGNNCRDILIKFYYERYSINAIMHEMKYKNENTVKAHKSRCPEEIESGFQNDTI